MLEQHYTVKDAVKILKVSERTIWTWVKDGRLKSIKVGAIVRIPASSFTALGFSVKDDQGAADDR